MLFQLDLDGDGYNWDYLYQTRSESQNPYSLFWYSQSYHNGTHTALNVDNLLVFGPFDFTNYSTNNVDLKLDFKVKSLMDSEYPQLTSENFTVYGVSIPNLNESSIVNLYNDNAALATGNTTNLYDWQTVVPISLNSLKGLNPVYISIRHHRTSDMFSMGFDDIKITSTVTASTQDFEKLGLSMYPNPVYDVLNIVAANGNDIQNIIVTDINGRTVKQTTTSQVNVSDLAQAAYLVKVTTTQGIATSKFIKK